MEKLSQLHEYEYLYLTNAEGTRGRIGFLPIGSLESHGKSLPLGTDALMAQAFALAFARKVHGVAFPGVLYGYCPHTARLSGTISLPVDTFLPYVTEVCRALHREACDTLIIVNIHRGNDAVISLAVDEIFQRDGLSAYYVDPYTFLGEDANKRLFPGKDNSYKEASLLLASLHVLGDPRTSCYVSERDEVRTDSPELRRLRQHGTLGFSYPDETAHIAGRKDVDVHMGLSYFQMAEEKIAELVDAWRDLER